MASALHVRQAVILGSPPTVTQILFASNVMTPVHLALIMESKAMLKYVLNVQKVMNIMTQLQANVCNNAHLDTSHHQIISVFHALMTVSLVLQEQTTAWPASLSLLSASFMRTPVSQSVQNSLDPVVAFAMHANILVYVALLDHRFALSVTNLMEISSSMDQTALTHVLQVSSQMKLT